LQTIDEIEELLPAHPSQIAVNVGVQHPDFFFAHDLSHLSRTPLSPGDSVDTRRSPRPAKRLQHRSRKPLTPVVYFIMEILELVIVENAIAPESVLLISQRHNVPKIQADASDSHMDIVGSEIDHVLPTISPAHFQQEVYTVLRLGPCPSSDNRFPPSYILTQLANLTR
jgi:hypothetical protein